MTKRSTQLSTLSKPIHKGIAMKSTTFRYIAASALLIGGFLQSATSAAAVDFAQSPMLTLKAAPSLVMLTMGRDLPLYRAAYNDVNDIDGDGVPDIYFKPAFKYEGYFAYDRCYASDTATFTPTAYGTKVVVDANDTSKDYYKCPGAWSGNFLNWVTMARIDVLLKVLYGGKRSTDDTNTILERTYVPQDSTLWGKEYASIARDGYSIADYTPLALPTGTAGVNKHFFVNVTLQGTTAIFSTTVNPPKMIVYQNQTGRIWDTVATEQTILGTNPSGTGITHHVVRVKTCVMIPATGGKYEDMCTGYPTNAPTAYKPTGLLHKYGETKQLAFGLLSGTYDNNYAGGVLRQNIDDFNREVNPANGRFLLKAGTPSGIIHHLDSFRPWGFGSSTWGGEDYTKWNFNQVPGNGHNPMWGNPLGEMMLESLRYFAGLTPSTAFTTGVGTNRAAQTSSGAPNYVIPRVAAQTSPETPLKLVKENWINPYTANASRLNSAAYPQCARPIQMTIGDPKTSFDSDHLPGSSFSIDGNKGVNAVPTLGTLNVSAEADLIWSSEFTGSKKFFIGEAPGNVDGNPSAKNVTSFKNIRGHGPDSTQSQGSFYGASVARFGKYTGVLNPQFPTTPLRVEQISIALDSHVPKIQIPMANGKSISLVLMSKSMSDFGLTVDKTKYQGTGQITAFFIESMANTNATNIDTTVNSGYPYYKFRISFSDMDQGGDNESDSKIAYEIKLNGPASTATSLTIGMQYAQSTTGIEMHQGYVISGTTNDGLYLDVGGGNAFGTPPPAAKLGYYLDTMPGKSPGSAMTDLGPTGGIPTGPSYTNITSRLPLSTLASPRTFTAGTNTNGEFVPHDMLWYAAKYGSATIDAKTGAFTGYKLKTNGDPENYYLVNNPSTLAAQMGQAFQKAASVAVASASAVAPSGAKVTGNDLIYQAGFDSTKWGGELRAFKVLPDGNISDTPEWLATAMQPAPAARVMVLGRGGTSKASITPSSYSSLTTAEKTAFGNSDAKFQYLLGDRSREQPAGAFRTRTSAIGDVVNSDPLYIGKANFGNADADYTAFKDTSNPNVVAMGTNDGAFRLIDGTTGVEKIAFYPQATIENMYKLADVNYTHQYYVDGPSAFGHVRASSTSPWNTVVAASAGAGGKSFFALNASSTNYGSSSVLWEQNSNSTFGGLIGNITNKPLVAQINDNNVGAVIVGNGANSTDDKANLLVINALTGAFIRNCKPSDAANAVGNGMTSVASLSLNNNGKIDYVYGADYLGNIWRMDPNQSSCNAGSNAVKLFSAKDVTGKAQPITGELTITKAPAGKAGYMLLFGTGKYATAADVANTDIQTMYGVWDDLGTSASFTRSNLLAYSFGAKNANNTRSLANATTVNGGKAWYEATPAGASTYKGWMVDLSCSGCPAGERFVDKVGLAGASDNPIAYFLSYVPSSDPCKVGGGAWLTGIDPATGAYNKAYKGLEENSLFVSGATPRGLVIVTIPATSTTPASELIGVLTNKDPDAGSEVNPDKSGANTPGSDGSGTGIKLYEGEPPTPTTPATTQLRRQVWRQIQ
jgi:type IV pilus assembly protein PilY1